jgi:hypothetical protein
MREPLIGTLSVRSTTHLRGKLLPFSPLGWNSARDSRLALPPTGFIISASEKLRD